MSENEYLISELFNMVNIKINNWYLNFICTVSVFDDLNKAKRFASINKALYSLSNSSL